MNLRVTSVVSRLAYIPHPNLNEFLLDTFLPNKDDVRTLPSVLKKVNTRIIFCTLFLSLRVAVGYFNHLQAVNCQKKDIFYRAHSECL